MVAPEGLDECILIHNLAAGDVDEHSPRLPVAGSASSLPTIR
jgi:hypothetical protein